MLSEEEKEEKLEFAKKLLDTSEGFYVQVGKPTFIMLIDIIAEQQKELEKYKEFKLALIDMVLQFADRSKDDKKINTMGLSALEHAFAVLDLDNVTKVKDLEKEYKKLYEEINNENND
jgi:hypothetical protein